MPATAGFYPEQVEGPALSLPRGTLTLFALTINMVIWVSEDDARNS